MSEGFQGLENRLLFWIPCWDTPFAVDEQYDEDGVLEQVLFLDEDERKYSSDAVEEAGLKELQELLVEDIELL